ASYWINTGSLLNRMNFGLAFATEKIPGIKLNLAALNNNHEPESIAAALNIYSNTLLSERDNSENIERLMPLINNNNLEKKLNNAINVKNDVVMNEKKNNNMIAQVVGVIIGSPEFQRK
ncbi:MAG TPA: hypothetical protein VHP12_09320, partial [Chitinophagaceae bacterium]|nr:hypothetical protein [Chitinophagaceae bacterium]